MRVLGINTVGPVCEAALVSEAGVLAEASEPMSQGHDARLAPVVDETMRRAGLDFAALDRIAVVVGPGSFVGMRVGVAFARGLGLALERPVIGVTSLEALGMRPGRVLGLLPAKRKPPDLTWWAQVLQDGRGVAEPEEAGLDRLTALAREVDGVIGAHVEGIGKLATPADASATEAARLALMLTPPFPRPSPIYVREPDATPMARP